MAQLPAVLLAQEQLTVSTSEKTITGTKFDNGASPAQNLDVLYGIFSHLSGGKIYHAEKWLARGDIAAVATVSNSGANGEIEQEVGDKWKVSGVDALKVWTAIIDSGGADALINVALYGRVN